MNSHQAHNRRPSCPAIAASVTVVLAVAEIARVSKHESNSLPSKAASYTSHVKSLISNGEKQAGGVSRSGHDDDINISSLESGFVN
uniref:Uncharacterized protein n=1 Tax=Cucumis melo TaxID=3656 RepID=A0A9I9E9P5_CUCME